MDEATAAEIARLKEVVVEAREKISDLGGSTSKVSDKLGATAGALGTFTGAMNSGAQGMSAYNSLVSTVSGNLANLAKNADGSATALSVLASASGSLITAIFKQSDALFKSYQDISQIGAAGSSGMQGVFDSMQQFGYSLEELPKFGALLAENSEALALFGGTVAQGVKQFANVSEGIQRSGLQTEFLRMGMSVDSINKGTAAYLKIQTATGASANKTQAELTAGAAEYIRQQDILTKLTGKSAETLAKAEEARQADERYRATQIELEMKAAAAEQAGDAESAAAFRDQITQNRLVLDTLPKELQAGAKDLQAGFANSPEAKKFLVSMPEMAQKLMSQNYKASEVLTAGQKEADRLTRANTGLAKAGAFNRNFVDYGGAANFAAMGRAQTPTESREKAEAERKAMAEKPETAVANQVAIRQSQQEITRAMNSLVQTGVHAATAAMQKLTMGIEAGVTRIPGTGDKTGTRNTPGRGDREDTGFQGKIITPEIIRQNQGTIDKFMNPGATLRDIAKDIIGPLSGANTVVPAAAKISAATQSAADSARLAAKATPAPVQAATLAKSQFDTGPKSTLSAPVGDTTPTAPVTAPAATTNSTNPDMLITSLNELLQSNRSQQASLEELIDLSRRNLAQGGKLVLAARQ
jgi:hypothetical protein